jgi:hypothetical protein
MVLDNTATKNRAWHETAGSSEPIAGQSAAHGRAFEVHANPPDRFPTSDGSLRFVRTIGDEKLWSIDVQASSRHTEYGSPFTPGPRKPYDALPSACSQLRQSRMASAASRSMGCSGP